jgi:uncharacterized protein with von Willebrand factor type A (vWA) domain
MYGASTPRGRSLSASSAEDQFSKGVEKLKEVLPRASQKYLKPAIHSDFENLETLDAKSAKLNEFLENLIRASEECNQNKEAVQKG